MDGAGRGPARRDCRVPEPHVARVCGGPEALVTRIASRLQQALDFPELGGRVPELDTPMIRQLIEWPYRLIYRPHNDVIEVLAIVHVRRDLHQIELG